MKSCEFVGVGFTPASLPLPGRNPCSRISRFAELKVASQNKLRRGIHARCAGEPCADQIGDHRPGTHRPTDRDREAELGIDASRCGHDPNNETRSQPHSLCPPFEYRGCDDAIRDWEINCTYRRNTEGYWTMATPGYHIYLPWLHLGQRELM